MRVGLADVRSHDIIVHLGRELHAAENDAVRSIDATYPYSNTATTITIGSHTFNALYGPLILESLNGHFSAG
jgi:hypothetical protein